MHVSILSRADELVAWASDIKEYALQQAISGKEWAGWKLVEGRSNRKYSNEEAVIQAVQMPGLIHMKRSSLVSLPCRSVLCKACHARIHAERGDRWHNT